MSETAHGIPQQKRTAKLISGIVLVVAGLCVLVQLSGLWNLEPLMRHWWALFLIVPALISMLATGPRNLNVMLFLLGVCMFLYSWGIIPENALKALPGLLLIYIGVRHLSGGTRRSRRLNRQ